MNWRWFTRITVALILVVMFLSGLLATHFASGISPWSVLSSIRNGEASSRYGWLIFAAIEVVVASSGILPASMLGVFAGTLYGLWFGFALAACSTMLGALGAFALSRSLFHPLIGRILVGRPRLQALNIAISQDSWRTVCLLRLSPVMPFAATSYTLGLTGISPIAYAAGTLACLPALLGYVLIGCSASTGFDYLAHRASIVSWVVLGGGTVATLILTFRIGVIIRGVGLAGEQL